MVEYHSTSCLYLGVAVGLSLPAVVSGSEGGIIFLPDVVSGSKGGIIPILAVVSGNYGGIITLPDLFRSKGGIFLSPALVQYLGVRVV